MTNLSRRRFLRGDLSRPALQRPPWALADADFLTVCTRCGDCLAACPTGILVADAGYPRVDFSRGECTFCAACVAACKPCALHRGDVDAPPWRITAKVAPSCLAVRGVECRACGDPCAAGAIRFSPRLGGPPLPQVDAALCTGCGACVAPCPAGAISVAPQPA